MKILLVIIWSTGLMLNNEGGIESTRPVGLTQIEYDSIQKCEQDRQIIIRTPKVLEATCLTLNTTGNIK